MRGVGGDHGKKGEKVAFCWLQGDQLKWQAIHLLLDSHNAIPNQCLRSDEASQNAMGSNYMTGEQYPETQLCMLPLLRCTLHG